MKQPPTLEAIYAAELRVVQARQRTGDSLARARTSLRAQRALLRARLARPQTLIAVAATAGLLGFWLMRRSRTRRAAAAPGPAVKTSLAGLLLASFMRYGRPAWPFLARQARAAWQRHQFRAVAAAELRAVRSQNVTVSASQPSIGALH